MQVNNQPETLVSQKRQIFICSGLSERYCNSSHKKLSTILYKCPETIYAFKCREWWTLEVAVGKSGLYIMNHHTVLSTFTTLALAESEAYKPQWLPFRALQVFKVRRQLTLPSCWGEVTALARARHREGTRQHREHRTRDKEGLSSDRVWI